MTAHTRTHSVADTTPAVTATGNGPERKPLLVRWGKKIGTTFVDGIKVCKPGDSDYEEEYAYAVLMHTEYGKAMPYARSLEERGAGSGSGAGTTKGAE